MQYGPNQDPLQELQNLVGKKLAIRINDNRSTMVSVKWEPDMTRVSLHRMFLSAPFDIRYALAKYLKGDDKQLAPSVKAYIEESMPLMDYAKRLDLSSLAPFGTVYDLKDIYFELNEEYFDSKLALHITWFGNHVPTNRRKCSLGLFLSPCKLIKIHRLLDHVHIPPFVLHFVVYHEMLHAVCPIKIDERGYAKIHSAEFRKKEVEFREYAKAQQWLKANQDNFFIVKGSKNYGRTQQMGQYQASESQKRCKKRQGIY